MVAEETAEPLQRAEVAEHMGQAACAMARTAVIALAQRSRQGQHDIDAECEGNLRSMRRQPTPTACQACKISKLQCGKLKQQSAAHLSEAACKRSAT